MSISSFLAEIPTENFPQEFGPWMSYEQFDPQFPSYQLAFMNKSGIVELDEFNKRFRLTLKATKFLQKKHD